VLFDQPCPLAYDREGSRDPYGFRVSNMLMGGSGLTGLSEMFSLKAVERPTALAGPVLTGSSGSVSDRFTRFLITAGFASADISFVLLGSRECIAGNGRREGGICAEGSLEWEVEAVIPAALRPRDGRGRLLNVLLLGMPPMGSSGRRM